MTATNLTLQPATKFYSQHQNKIIFLVVVLLALYLWAFIAELTWRLIPQAEVNSQNAFQTTTSNAGQLSSRFDVAPLTKINLFGDPEAKPIAVVQTEVTDVPETSLNLTLTGVVSSTNPKVGAAIVENNGKQNTYGIGDKIDGTNATLDEIFVDRVIIKNRLNRETLMLDGVDFDEANQRRQQAIEEQSSDRGQIVETPQGPLELRMPERKGESARELREKLRESPSSFTDFIAINPHAPDGDLIGYRVSPGKEPEFFREVGLQAGDVITAINGIDLTDPQQAFEAIAILREAQSLQLEVLRGDEALSLDIDIPSSEE
jgi:general secretion pathway protein C